MTHKIMQWLCGAVLALLPLYVVRYRLFGLPSTVLEGVLVITLLAWILWQWRRRKEWKTRPVRVLWWRWIVPVALFVVASGVSVWVAPDRLAAVGLWRAYVAWPLIYSWIVYTTWNDQPPRRALAWLCRSLTVAGLIVSVGAIVQWLGGFPIPDPQYEGLHGAERRMTSIFPYPAAVGLLLTPIVAMQATLLVERVRRARAAVHTVRPLLRDPWMWTYGVSAALGGVAIFLAKTDGAIAALAVVGGILVWRLCGWKWTAMIGVLALLIVIASPFRQRALDVVTFQDNSGQVRLVLWQGTWNLIQDRPILGAGLGGFTQLYDQYRLQAHAESTILYPHTVVLNFWAELGLLGLVSVVWLIGVFAVYAWRLRGHVPIRVAAMMLLATLVYGLVDVPFFKNDLAVVWWIPFVCVWLVWRQKERSLEKNPQA